MFSKRLVPQSKITRSFSSSATGAGQTVGAGDIPNYQINLFFLVQPFKFFDLFRPPISSRWLIGTPAISARYAQVPPLFKEATASAPSRRC
jgi:hypothetical protein